MKLAEQLALRTPLVWVTTSEPGRVIDEVIQANPTRPVFRLDGIKGLLKHDAERGWLRVLVWNPMTEMLGPTDSQAIAFDHVLQNNGVMFVENAHMIAEALSSALFSLVFQYREMFYNDDADEVPCQFILMSHEDKIPGEIARMTAHVRHELPDNKELEVITSHLDVQLGLTSPHQQVARAGIGLSETEFISSVLTSVREHGEIRPESVNHTKLELLKANGILEVRTPKLGIDDLGGLDNAKVLVSQIGKLWSAPEEFEALGLRSIRRVMFIGVPGTGKSLICEAIAKRLGLDLAKGGVSNTLSKWIGESEQNMRRMFETLHRMAPITFWIDEVGRDLSGGGTANDSGTTDRVHGEFLTGLQEMPENVFFAAAANNIEGLPPEMTRSGRFDRIMFVGFPTLVERREIFQIHLGEAHVDHNLHDLAEATDFFTGAEIQALIASVSFEVGVDHRRRPTTDEILKAVPETKGRVWNNHRQSMVNMYLRAQTEWDWASSGQKKESDRVLAAARGVASYSPKQVAGPAAQRVKGW